LFRRYAPPPARLNRNVRRQMSDGMSRRQAAWWQRLRRHGRLRFVLLYGVVLWSGISTLMWVGSMWFTSDREYFARTFFSQPLTLIFAVVLGGAVFGFLVWEFNEMRYRRSLEDDRAAN